MHIYVQASFIKYHIAITCDNNILYVYSHSYIFLSYQISTRRQDFHTAIFATYQYQY